MWFFQAIQHLLPISKTLANQIESFCIDSRKASTKSLFFALKGERVDGHQYLLQAEQNGAVAAVIEKKPSIMPQSMELIYVKDVKHVLQEMAKAVVSFWQPIIIAVTGSLGKTSTKDFLIEILKKKYSVSGTPGNYNSQLTLPLTILNVKNPTQLLVLEMGIDRPFEIDRLLEIAPPNHAILTMLAHVHVESFGTFENLAEEKMKIFTHAQTTLGLYNLDMPFSEKIFQNKTLKKKVSYSLKNENADYFLKMELEQFQIFKNKKLWIEKKSPFFDFKSHYNLLAAIAMADQLQVDTAKIESVIPYLKHAPNRLQKIHKNGITFICDAYNANLDSMENALHSLRKEKGRKIAILSDMVEQGVYQEENHQRLLQSALENADILIGFGQGLKQIGSVWRKSKKRWAFFLSYSNMLAYIFRLIRKGDIILLKGSRKSALERILNDLNFN